MDNPTLTAKPATGCDLNIAGNRIQERADLAIVSLAIPLNGEDAFAKTLRSSLGLKMPSATQATTGDDTLSENLFRSGFDDENEARSDDTTYALRTGPDQLLLFFPHSTPDAETVIQEKMKGTAYTTDQTDSWTVFELSGTDLFSAMERLCPIDITTKENGAFARTVMEHMGALVLRTGDESILLASASSSADSFLHAIETSFRNVT